MHHGMYAIDPNIHQGAVGKLRLKCVFDDPLFVVIIAGRILTKAEKCLPKLSQTWESFFQHRKLRGKRRTHGLKKNHALLPGCFQHLFIFLLVRSNRLFTKHMFARLHHLNGLLTVAIVRAGNIYSLYVRVFCQFLKRIIKAAGAVFFSKRPGLFQAAGIDRKQPQFGNLRRSL